MLRSILGCAVVCFAVVQFATAGDVASEDFQSGFKDGEPLRVHRDWFYGEQNEGPASAERVGIEESWGVTPGDRAFTWIGQRFHWTDSELAWIVVGGDWQTDSEGRLDDDRAGWTINNNDDDSSNIFGVQIDPAGGDPTGEQLEEAESSELNIEAYWDGDSFGDNAGRTSIVKLPQLKPNTWYRLRAKFTKLSPKSAKIDVTFVELDGSGQPTGDVHKGTLEDTSALPGTEGDATPNTAYFTASTVWPVFKNFSNREGGFDNAYFEIQHGEEPAESTDAE
jgi:hypothetical protein